MHQLWHWTRPAGINLEKRGSGVCDAINVAHVSYVSNGRGMREEACMQIFTGNTGQVQQVWKVNGPAHIKPEHAAIADNEDEQSSA